MDIKNCAVIISGGASGMGAATAKWLSRAGAKVSIFDVNLEQAAIIAKEINGFAIQCDVTQEESVKKAIREAAKNMGPARICINCAGIVKGKKLLGKDGPMPVEEFRRVIDINLIGTFNLMRLAAEQMAALEPLGESQERGVIINTASIAAFEGQIGQIAYSASKGAIVSMTLPAARELSQFGIRVAAIAPGLVDTPMLAQIPPEAKKSLIDTLIFPKRLADPSEFASLAQHIIENPMLNGTVIRLDGALRMQPK